MALSLLVGLAVVVAVSILVYAAGRQAASFGKMIAVAVMFSFCAYFAILLVVSFTSKERVLGLNEEKKFCGFYLDCHLGISVVSVEKRRAIGTPPNQMTAAGTFYIVTVRVGNDAKRASIGLLEVNAVVVDRMRRTFTRSVEAERILENGGAQGSSLEQLLKPDESLSTRIVFDIPSDAVEPSMMVTEGYGIDHFIELLIIGDEDSLFHKKTRFRLDAN